MNTGIFGGTFNPIHNGHLKALQDFIHFGMLDRAIVFPTGIPPHKSFSCEISGRDRLAMVRLACAGIAEVDDMEMRKPGKSYTVDTIEYVKKKYPQDHLFLYVGSDMLLDFERVWHRFEDILQMVTIVALSRTGSDYTQLKKYADDLNRRFNADVRLYITPPQVVSSTLVRKMLHEGTSVHELVPKAVSEYIDKNGLYRNRL